MTIDFTMMMWVQNREAELGSPQKLIWVLNFSGLKTMLKYPLKPNPVRGFRLL